MTIPPCFDQLTWQQVQQLPRSLRKQVIADRKSRITRKLQEEVRQQRRIIHDEQAERLRKRLGWRL